MSATEEAVVAEVIENIFLGYNILQPITVHVLKIYLVGRVVTL